jgi:hypothetical protein
MYSINTSKQVVPGNLMQYAKTSKENILDEQSILMCITRKGKMTKTDHTQCAKGPGYLEINRKIKKKKCDK